MPRRSFFAFAASFAFFLPSVALAQAMDLAEAAVGQVRLALQETGVGLLYDAATFDGGVGILTGVRVFTPLNEDGYWSLRIPEVRVDARDAGRMTIGVESSAIAAEARPVAGGTLLKWDVEALGTSLVLTTDAQGGELAGVEASGSRWAAKLTANNASPFTTWDMAIESPRLADVESDRAHAERAFSWGSATARVATAPDSEGGTLALDVALGEVTVEATHRSGGFLETMPWFAAIKQGMALEAKITLDQGRFGIESSESGESSRFEGAVSRLDLAAVHDVEGADVTVSARRVDAVYDRGALASALSFVWEDVAAVLRTPTHGALAPQPFAVELSGGGGVTSGSKSWPVSGSLKAAGTMTLAVDPYDFNAASGVGKWRPLLTTVTSVDATSLAATLEADGDTLALEGAMSMTTTEPISASGVASTQGLGRFLAFLGESGLVSEGANQVVLDALSVAFGPRVGQDPARARLTFTNGALAVEPMEP